MSDWYVFILQLLFVVGCHFYWRLGADAEREKEAKRRADAQRYNVEEGPYR
jgi:hypothetical protein